MAWDQITAWWERTRSRFDYATKSDLKALEKKLHMEIQEKFNELTTLARKVKTEVLPRIQKLEDAIKNRSLTAEERAEFDAAKAVLLELDEATPDEPTQPQS